MDKQKIKEVIEGKEYFTRISYLVECTKLNEKRKALDEKRQQYEEDIYELKNALETSSD